MRQTNKEANTQLNVQESDDDPVRADIDEFRYELSRRINRFIANRKQYWRDCKERSCRRQHTCLAPHVRCSNAPPLPPDPSGQRAAGAMARV